MNRAIKETITMKTSHLTHHFCLHSLKSNLMKRKLRFLEKWQKVTEEESKNIKKKNPWGSYVNNLFIYLLHGKVLFVQKKQLKKYHTVKTKKKGMNVIKKNRN